MTTEAQPLSVDCCLFDAQIEETVRERQRKLAAFEIATMNIVDTEVVSLIRIIDACRAENDLLTRQLKIATDEVKRLAEYIQDGGDGQWCGHECGTFLLDDDDFEHVTFYIGGDEEGGVLCRKCYDYARDTLAAAKEAGDGD